MFTVHVDACINFTPWMADHGRGVVLTRTIQLPFPAYSGLVVFSRKVDECPMPEGMSLQDVIWDMDREVFLATTRYGDDGLPITLIPGVLREWAARGWRFGSYRDAYAEPEPPPEEPATKGGRGSWRRAERAHLLGWEGRTRAENRVVRAVIRHAAEHHDNESAGYALDRTGWFFTEDEFEKGRTDSRVERFHDAVQAFRDMTDRSRDRWRARAIQSPSLQELASQPPRTTRTISPKTEP